MYFKIYGRHGRVVLAAFSLLKSTAKLLIHTQKKKKKSAVRTCLLLLRSGFPLHSEEVIFVNSCKIPGSFLLIA